MKWRKIFIVAVVVFLVLASALIFVYLLSPQKDEDGSFKVQILVENLDTPWAIDFLPDGMMIFTERRGLVSIFDGTRKKVVGQINANEESESGLLGIAVDPEFEKNSFVYVYYTHENGNRIARFILAGKNLDEFSLQNELVLIDNIPNARFHDVGRMKFGPDKKLYATTGDATVPSSAQDINSLAGKILRMNKDGTVPEDNPFGNYVWTYGHRNPQGIAWDVDRGIMYSSEHGPTKNDEVNAIESGKNYGWPSECSEPSNEYKNPIRCYAEFVLAPAGIAFYNGNLYVAALRGTQLRRLKLGEDGKAILEEKELVSDLGRIREAIVHDGNLYIATSNKDGRGVPRLNDDKIAMFALEKSIVD